MVGSTKSTEKERQGLLKKNLAAFKKYAPPLYQALSNHRPSSQLIFDDDGAPDVIVNGKPLFGGRAVEHAEEGLEAFHQEPTNIAFGTPDTNSFDRFGNATLRKVLDRAKAEGIGFSKGLPSGNDFFLLIFGVELGFHINALVEETDCYVIFFVEPNLDHLYHSLQTYPWHSLYKRQADRNGFIFITTFSHPQKVAAQIQGVVRTSCPPAIDGMPCFGYSSPELAKSVTNELIKGAGYMVGGLGFLYDETLMMKNTYLNLSSGTANVFVRAKTPDITTSVFVVSAGASLDNDIDFIRDNADKVIIVSTGTALRSLLVNGITPDFHVEIENVHVYSSIKPLAQEYDLSSICLMAPSDIEHHTVQFFDDIIYFFRPALSPYPLYCQGDENSLPGCWPLVINASFSVAIEIGAKDIYLFGADFGSRGGSPDHAKDNVIFTDDAVIGYSRDYGFGVPANFEGQFFASADFVQGLNSMVERILFCAPGRRFFNCSDGALVDGAAPVHARDLRLKGTAKRKQRYKKNIRNRHVVMSDQWFRECWDEDRLRDAVNAFADKTLAILADADAFRDKGYLARYMVHVRPERRYADKAPALSQRGSMETSIATMFRGSLDGILIGLVYFLGRLANPKDEPHFHEIVAEELSTVIEDMRRLVLEMIDDPAVLLPAKVDGEWKDEDFIQEAYYTWGDTPRNAPCPCGSGRRYKHCHGKN